MARDTTTSPEPSPSPSEPAPPGRRKRPSTQASSAPVRTSIGSALPPTRSSIASTTMVLPAPVSPVTAVMPPPITRRSSAMTPRSRTANSTSTAFSPGRAASPTLPIAQPELGLQDPQEVAGPEGHEPGGELGRRAHDGVAPGQRAEVVAVDRQRGGAVARDLDAHPGRGREDERSVEQHVR